MGCLNSQGQFDHWFGNIHLSGPCNRACYFCIGQHMMALDPLNNLDTFPLKNLDKFVAECRTHGISEINLTGSNTDPSLYKHIPELRAYLERNIPNLCFGLRTNGVAHQDVWKYFDKGSISITTFNKELYKETMGCGSPPNIRRILEINRGKDIKVNIVLCPEIVETGDIFDTIRRLEKLGVQTINVREPYGQPHIGDPLKGKLTPVRPLFGMPTYQTKHTAVTYWDVHYVEVESVNLYANGEVSTTYPVSKGHCPKTGKVLGQEYFTKSGRICQQWQKTEDRPQSQSQHGRISYEHEIQYDNRINGRGR